MPRQHHLGRSLFVSSVPCIRLPSFQELRLCLNQDNCGDLMPHGAPSRHQVRPELPGWQSWLSPTWPHSPDSSCFPSTQGLSHTSYPSPHTPTVVWLPPGLCLS